MNKITINQVRDQVYNQIWNHVGGISYLIFDKVRNHFRDQELNKIHDQIRLEIFERAIRYVKDQLK